MRSRASGGQAVALGDVQHQPAAQPGRFLQAVLDADAVVAHGHVHVAGPDRPACRPGSSPARPRRPSSGARARHAEPMSRTPRSSLKPWYSAKARGMSSGPSVSSMPGCCARTDPAPAPHNLPRPAARRSGARVQAEDLLAQHQAGAAARGRHGQIALELAAIMRGDADPPGRHVHSCISPSISIQAGTSKPLAPYKKRHPGRTEPAPPSAAPLRGSAQRFERSTPFDKMRRTGPGTASAPCPSLFAGLPSAPASMIRR